MSKTFQFGNGEWAVGKETALAYNDENSNFKPLAFTFDRSTGATVVNKQGLIETVGVDEPRIDFLNNSKGHLLLEPERRNLVKSSGDISTQSTYWLSNQGGTSIQNATTAPDGTNTASQINTFGQQYSGLSQGSISVSNTEYTYSIYLKAKNGTPSISLIYFDGVTLHSSDFTISSEWERYDYKFTPLAGTSQIYITCRYVETSFYTWGAQLEQGSYATSYIPTQGETNGVTRNRDSVVQTVPDGIVQENEMTLYAEFEYLGGQDTQLISVHNNSSSVIWIVINGSNQLSGTNFYNSAFNASVTMTSTITPNTRYKVAYRTKSGDSALYVNGVSQGVSTQTISNPNTLRRIELGSFWNGINANTNSKIIEAKCYNNALTNSELATLTTL